MSAPSDQISMPVATVDPIPLPMPIADLKKRAEDGSEEAQIQLARLHLEGRGVERSEEEAIKLLRMATGPSPNSWYVTSIPEALQLLANIYYRNGNPDAAAHELLEATARAEPQARLLMACYQLWAIPSHLINSDDRLERAKLWLKETTTGNPTNPSVKLASAIQKLIKEEDPHFRSPIRLISPNNHFANPIIGYDIQDFNIQGDGIRCSYQGTHGMRDVVLIIPKDKDRDDSISESIARCAPPHPKVIGPSGCTTEVEFPCHSGAPKISFALVCNLIDEPLISATLMQRTKPEFFKETALKFATDIAEGLAHLHSHGIVHGNVSANSIVIKKSLVFCFGNWFWV